MSNHHLDWFYREVWGWELLGWAFDLALAGCYFWLGRELWRQHRGF